MKFYEERSMFIESLIDRVRQVPLQKIIGSRMQLVPRGRHLMGLCPFHRDKHLGSFLVTPDKGIWKCFTCGDEYSGDAITFVSKYDGIEWLEAVFQISLEEGLCSRDEYEKYYRTQKFTKKYKDTLRERTQVKFEKYEEVKADPKVIDAVLTTMQEVCPLSVAHKKQLLTERNLTQERIDSDYFEFPYYNREKVVRLIMEKLPWITTAELITVPGFYYDNESKAISFAGYKGVGILIRNTEYRKDGKQRAVAVQIRRDAIKEGQKRYGWFSSSFVHDSPDGKYTGGCGCGCPKDVLFPAPDKKFTGNVCITEGRFKSEIIIQNGNIAVSVQGVSSWFGIEDIIKQISQNYPVKRIYTMFDSDMAVNPAVFGHAENMSKALENAGFKVSFASWPLNKGKGIDDLILNGNKDSLRYHSPSETSEIFHRIFSALLTEYRSKNIREIPEEKIDRFREELRIGLEKELCK